MKNYDCSRTARPNSPAVSCRALEDRQHCHRVRSASRHRARRPGNRRFEQHPRLRATRLFQMLPWPILTLTSFARPLLRDRGYRGSMVQTAARAARNISQMILYCIGYTRREFISSSLFLPSATSLHSSTPPWLFQRLSYFYRLGQYQY